MKLLGIDYGTKRIGLAMGDTETKVAVPLRTVEVGKKFWDEFLALVRKEQIEMLVVGWPKGGAEAEQMVKKFIDELGTRVPLPIKIENEQFTTQLAHRLLGKIKKDRDAVAAAIILQSFFDRGTPFN